ncbi:MAG: hypothetical protein Kow0092_21370 [Deferrisomatales bacterium]
MAGGDGQTGREIRVNERKLYREETYTDTEVASLRQLVPILPDGSRDESREPIFLGQTFVVTEAGPLPVQAELQAKTLQEAIREFPEAAKKALDRMVSQAREAKRRQEQAGSGAQGKSPIVAP